MTADRRMANRCGVVCWRPLWGTAHRMGAAGDHGAKTPFDVASGWLSPRSPEELRVELL